MSDHSFSDDELLSSSLDGELTVDEAALLDARLAGEPELVERLAALRAADALAAAPVAPLAPADADRMIAAALAASSTASNVTDLAAASSRRKVWPARLATVAAGVIALALAVPAIRALDSDNDSSNDAGALSASDTADSFETSPADDDSAADLSMESAALAVEAADSEMAGDDSASGLGSDGDGGSAAPTIDGQAQSAAMFDFMDEFDPLPDDLGPFADTNELSESVSTNWADYQQVKDADTPATTTSTDQGGGDDSADDLAAAALGRLESVGLSSCGDILQDIANYFGDVQVIAADYAVATVADDVVTVGVFEMVDGTATVLVIDPATCDFSDVVLAGG